jgi:hypothetical protein
MTGESNRTRRTVLKTGLALGAMGVGLGAGAAAANPGKGKGADNGRTFGRVYANGTLWRTHAVRVLDEAPHPQDLLYFLHYDGMPIVASLGDDVEQAAAAVSESAPGDQDWNGGKWVTYSAEVTDLDDFVAAAPVDSADEILDADFVTVTQGRATRDDGTAFGPPAYFICPLNGRA